MAGYELKLAIGAGVVQEIGSCGGCVEGKHPGEGFGVE